MLHQPTARATAQRHGDPAGSRRVDHAGSWSAAPSPISELGCLLVLTQLLAAPIASAMAIETVQLAARQLGWQPVGDVLRSALERCLARQHLRIDASGQIRLTTAGKRWLIAALARRFSALPQGSADLLLACQMISLPLLDAPSRHRIWQVLAAERRDHLRQRRACDRACPAALRPWQDWSRARVIVDLQRLERLDPNNASDERDITEETAGQSLKRATLAGDGDEGL